MSKRILILEDMGPRVDQFMTKWCDHNLVICNKPEDAIEALSNHDRAPFDLITLDHDLGMTGRPEKSDMNSGWAVAKHIGDGYKQALLIAHTWNPDGADRMREVCPRIVHIPFGNRYFHEVVFH